MLQLCKCSIDQYLYQYFIRISCKCKCMINFTYMYIIGHISISQLFVNYRIIMFSRPFLNMQFESDTSFLSRTVTRFQLNDTNASTRDCQIGMEFNVTDGNF